MATRKNSKKIQNELLAFKAFEKRSRGELGDRHTGINPIFEGNHISHRRYHLGHIFQLLYFLDTYIFCLRLVTIILGNILYPIPAQLRHRKVIT